MKINPRLPNKVYKIQTEYLSMIAPKQRE